MPAPIEGSEKTPIAAASHSTIQQIGFQVQPSTKAPNEDNLEANIQLEPPGQRRIFRLESEANLQERMRQEARERPTPERIIFPEEKPISIGQYVARQFPRRDLLVEPAFVCHDRLYFEELNSERYGWDLGFIQPAVSAGAFYLDLAMLPYNFMKQPCDRYECNSGKCLPGDPVPYMLYPPGLSSTGAFFEAGAALAFLAIFP
jgi:hypothetical protein